MPFIIIAAVLGLIILWGIGTYNSLVSGRTSVEEAFAGMDVYLKKRYDLIPNLVETVKGYAKHEKETLEAVISARSAAVSSTTIEGKIEAEQNLNGALGRLLALSEAYPDLKANTNFLELQDSLTKMEVEIASARSSYNAVVKGYNIRVQSVPSNIIASIFHFEKKPMFEVSSPVERENVKVQF